MQAMATEHGRLIQRLLVGDDTRPGDCVGVTPQ